MLSAGLIKQVIEEFHQVIRLVGCRVENPGQPLVVREQPAVVRQDQPAGEERKLAGGAGQRVTVAVALCLVNEPVLDERHAVEGFDALIVPGLGVDGNALQQGIEVGDMRVGGEGALERGAGRFVAPVGQVLKEREIDDLAVDETAVVVREVPAIDKQIARGPTLFERFIGGDNEEIHVRVGAGVALGDRTSNDQRAEARVVAVGVSQAVDGW